MQDGWQDIHNTTGPGLAKCYKDSGDDILKLFEISTVWEMLPVLLEVQNIHILLILIYRKRGLLGSFIDDLIQSVSDLPIDNHIIIVGDLNLDHLSTANISKLEPFLQQFNLYQHSQFSTHIYGGFLDLVLDSENSDSVSWMPSPYSDNFVILAQI